MRSSIIGKAVIGLVAVGVAFTALPMQASANSTIIIVNVDGPGEGFNDPTPRTPVGGNTGTTIGQQRLNAFQSAANVWGAALDSSVPIRIRAAFNPLTCTATSATLGSAGPLYVWNNFPGAGFPNTWYHEALANKQAQVDLNPPGDPADFFNGADINAQFNSSIGTVPGCFTGGDWYYGLDGVHGTKIDLFTVLLHEFGHGLGFSSLVNSGTGDYRISGLPGAFDLFVRDNTINKNWTAMTTAERLASAKNGRNVAWTGVNVSAAVPSVLSLGVPLLRITAPLAIAGIYPVGTAAYGPALNSPGVSGNVVLATDTADAITGASTTNGCEAITNPAAVLGKIAIVDRGGCSFVVKTARAQAAGAIGLLVANNVAGSPPGGLAGANPAITIPTVLITLAAGNAIKGQLAGVVTATLGVDLTIRAGADGSGRALLNTPDPVVPGSSVSHWDPVAFRNQLMEPAINADLTHSVMAPQDLTLAQMRDVGWFPDADVDGLRDSSDACPTSTLGATVIIEGCNTGVPNKFASAGCTITDAITACAASSADHAIFTGCVLNATTRMKNTGLITGLQQINISRCAIASKLP